MKSESCFAFRSFKKKKDGFTWQEEKCDCLKELYCTDGECPFYKNKNDLVKFNFKYGGCYWGVGYASKKDLDEV